MKLYLPEEVAPEIKRRKAKLKEIYTKYYSHFDNLSCGKTLAEYISPELTKLRVEWDECVKGLRELDPSMPKDMNL